MELILEKLVLKNFKGIPSLEIVFDKITSIFGSNSTGKTTILDAYLWLFIDKDSEGNANFDIKPIDPKTKKVIHNLETSVEGVFKADKYPITLKKIYKENWVKKRGSNKKSFSGHVPDYFVNDVPCKKKEYEDYINVNIASLNVIAVLSDLRFFNESMSWQERRKILADISGVESIESFAEGKIKQTLKGMTIEQRQKQLKYSMKNLNQDIKEIPVRIDEVNKISEIIKWPDNDILKLFIGRVNELERKEKQLAKQYESLEKELFTLEKLISQYMTFISDKVNNMFNLVEFKMFEEQINEGIKETCICMVDGVSYGSLNNGSRINAGIDIINRLSEHYGLYMPLFIDNKESVCQPLTLGIKKFVYLSVSEKDKELRVEHE